MCVFHLSYCSPKLTPFWLNLMVETKRASLLKDNDADGMLAQSKKLHMEDFTIAKIARIARIVRITRITRITKIARIARIPTMVKQNDDTAAQSRKRLHVEACRGLL